MIYALPLTGPDRKLGRICLICRAQSAPAVAAFVRPAVGENVRTSTRIVNLIGIIQALCDRHAPLQGAVVINAQDEVVMESNGETKESVRQPFHDDVDALAKVASTSILLASAPLGGFPDSVPVDPAAGNTILFFRNRQLSATFKDVWISTLDEADLAQSSSFQQLDRAASRVVGLG
jgi:hypothetical protein